MKPVAFSYLSAGDLNEAQQGLKAPNSMTVAGNQSLGPMLNLRLARPAGLVDISMIDSLRGVTETDSAVTFGAAVTHAEIEDGAVPDPTGGWIREAAANIANRAVRNRGTLGGSLCHADPAADWATIMIALFATAIVEGPNGTRRVALEDFIVGPYATALRDGELLTAVEVPKPGPGARWGYWKYVRQVGDFAKASAAVLLDPENNGIRCVIGALGRQPLLLSSLGEVLDGETSPADALAEAIREPPEGGLSLHAVALSRALSLAQADP